MSFDKACQLLSPLALMPWEEEGSLSLRNAISSSKIKGNIFPLGII